MTEDGEMIEEGHKNKHIVWIDSVKFLACVFVFWGHLYQCIYYYRLDKSSFEGPGVFIIEHVVYFLVFASWWVYVFCILSGVFAGQKRVNSGKRLFISIVNRYIRLFVPVLIANILVWIVYLFAPSPIEDFSRQFNNEWILHFEVGHKSFLDVIKSSVLLSEDFIPQLWMLKYIFFGTSIVYLFIYIFTKCKGVVPYIITGSMLLLAGILFIFVIATREFLIYSLLPLGGVIISKLWETNTVSKFKHINIIATIITILSLCFLNVHPNWLFGIVVALLFVFFIKYSSPAVKVLETTPFRKINYLSFTVYLFHLLVVCTFSLSFFMVIYDPSRYFLSAMTDFLLTTIIVIVGCYIYYFLVEKRVDMLVSKICNRITNGKNSTN